MRTVTINQQEYLRLVMQRLGFTRDALAARIGVSRKGLDKWLLPSNSGDFREMPDMAWKFLDEICIHQEPAEAFQPADIPDQAASGGA